MFSGGDDDWELPPFGLPPPYSQLPLASGRMRLARGRMPTEATSTVRLVARPPVDALEPTWLRKTDKAHMGPKIWALHLQLWTLNLQPLSMDLKPQNMKDTM